MQRAMSVPSSIAEAHTHVNAFFGNRRNTRTSPQLTLRKWLTQRARTMPSPRKEASISAASWAEPESRPKITCPSTTTRPGAPGASPPVQAWIGPASESPKDPLPG